jgi:hypothetical protein
MSPRRASLVALPFEVAPQAIDPTADPARIAPQHVAPPPRIPVLRLEPGQVSRRAPLEPFLRIGRGVTLPIAKAWRYAPRDARLLAMLVPLLLLAVLRPYLPQIARADSKSAAGLKAAVSSQWRVVKHNIASRAGIDLADDFRTGLDNWISRADAAAGWSYDAAGFVHPGSLALYEPSMNLSDYHVELMAQIDRKGLGAVVRATGFDRYQAVKLAILEPGALPRVALIHYPVIGGKQGPRTAVPLPFPARNDTVYHLKIETRGSDFIVYAQEKMVAFWSDKRFRNGGVGLFCGKGEDARVRWIEVMHQYDALGRLCAYLAPYGVQTSNGSWKQ